MKNKKKLVKADNRKKKKNNNVQRRTTIMIFLSGISILMMHLPDFIVSLFLASYFKYIINVYDIGLFEYSSQYYYDLASLLYFMYFSFNYFFFMLFDKNFRRQFYSFFFKTKSY